MSISIDEILNHFMDILVSNDDGVDAPGIIALAKYMKKIPKARVMVVAPDRNRSASSHSMTLHRPLRIEQVSKGFYAVDGTPTDSVAIGVNEVLKKIRPALVVSGINRGANLGEDVHYSGTVAAALEGALMGIPSIAVSIVGYSRNLHYDTAGAFVLKLAKKVLKEGLPPGVVLNVNVPNKKMSEIKGVEFTTMGRHTYADTIIKKLDPHGRPYYWIGIGSRNFENIKGSDCNVYQTGKISVTPIQLDLTDYEFLKKIKKWKV